MATTIRTRLLHPPKQESENRVIVNLFEENEELIQYYLKEASQSTQSERIPSKTNVRSLQRQRAVEHDYQAPLTAYSLKPNSKWLTVRRNLHRIRFMGLSNPNGQNRLPDLYLGLQMIRELKRAQEEIQHIDQEKNFHAVKHFVLAVDDKRTKTYNTSHIRPNDALFYDRLGEEPLALQNLLFYFSHHDVPHGSVFWDFLNEVNHVLSMKRKRKVLVQRLRRLAKILACLSYTIIGIMFLILIVSVATTITKLNDPQVHWVNENEEVSDTLDIS